ncbi:hypothetical protein [Pseudomonas koreensis]|uniref:hypothetical protein n=1 Tax=Pseudomonas koreensis TaxID=198620 RepID=UPI001475E69C|nr:hypothetical protein [Pseudomonas koreensis]NNA59020.1 hypothetical protein [Pseudomonas koreensis]
MNKEGSFTGYLYIEGYAPSCKLGFQYTDTTSTPSGDISSSGIKSIDTNLVKTDYLCANTVTGSAAALFHFEQTNNHGEYLITSRDPNYYNGCYLGIDGDSYIFAYRERSESNAFSFKKNGKLVTLNEMTGESAADMELVCRDGGIELHKKVVRDGTKGKQWAAYVCTKDGDIGLVGPKILLKIVARNID